MKSVSLVIFFARQRNRRTYQDNPQAHANGESDAEQDDSNDSGEESDGSQEEGDHPGPRVDGSHCDILNVLLF